MMSDSTDTQTQPVVEPNQQVTSKQPTTQPAKKPKRVAGGKAVAGRARQAREAQKKLQLKPLS